MLKRFQILIMGRSMMEKLLKLMGRSCNMETENKLGQMEATTKANG